MYGPSALACSFPGILYFTNTASPGSKWYRRSSWLRSVLRRYSCTIYLSLYVSLRLTSCNTASYHYNYYPISFSSTSRSSRSDVTTLRCSPHAPQCGDCLNTKRYGEQPKRVGNIRSPAAMSPTNSVQANSAPAATINFLRPSLMTLLYHSTRPFALGWALYISTCLHPILSR